MRRNLVDILMDGYASRGPGVVGIMWLHCLPAGLRIYGKLATNIYHGDERRYTTE